MSRLRAVLPNHPHGAKAEHHPAYSAVLALAASLGAVLPRHSVEAGGGSYLSTEQLCGAVPSATDCQAGDLVIVPRLADLGSGVAGTVRSMATAGVRLYACDIGPVPLSTHLQVIAGTAAAFSGQAGEIAKLKRDLAAVEDYWRRRHHETSVEAAKIAFDKASLMFAALPLLGEPVPNGTPKPKHLGEIIAHERQRQGLSQNQLGRAVDCAQSMIARLEAGDIVGGDVRERVMRHLFAGDAAKLAEQARVSAIMAEAMKIQAAQPAA